MTKTLYLHIGAHKTGSSAIQIACHNNLNALRAQGWDFAFEPGQPLNWGQCIRFGPAGPNIRFKFAPKWMERLRNRLSSPLAHTVILSVEDLFFLDGVDIENFCAMICDLFEDIHVVAYLRRQDELANSQKAQGAKTIQSARLFGMDPEPFPELTPAVRRYLSFAAKIAQWQQALPNAKMHLRCYRRDNLRHGDAAADFFELLGLDLPWRVGRINESFGAQSTRLALHIRALGVKHVILEPLVDNGWPIADQTPFLPSKSKAAAFLAEFATENDSLAKQFPELERFHKDFDRYPAKEMLRSQRAEVNYQRYVQRNLKLLTTTPAPHPLTPASQEILRPVVEEIFAELPAASKTPLQKFLDRVLRRSKSQVASKPQENCQSP